MSSIDFISATLRKDYLGKLKQVQSRGIIVLFLNFSSRQGTEKGELLWSQKNGKRERYTLHTFRVDWSSNISVTGPICSPQRGSLGRPVATRGPRTITYPNLFFRDCANTFVDLERSSACRKRFREIPERISIAPNLKINVILECAYLLEIFPEVGFPLYQCWWSADQSAADQHHQHQADQSAWRSARRS